MLFTSTSKRKKRNLSTIGTKREIFIIMIIIICHDDRQLLYQRFHEMFNQSSIKNSSRRKGKYVEGKILFIFQSFFAWFWFERFPGSVWYYMMKSTSLLEGWYKCFTIFYKPQKAMILIRTIEEFLTKIHWERAIW